MATSTVERMNITLPKKLAKRLRKEKNVSAFIAKSVEARFAELSKASAAAALAEEYRQSAIEDKEENEEWDALAGDGL